MTLGLFFAEIDLPSFNPGNLVKGIGIIGDFVSLIQTIKKLTDDSQKELLKKMFEVKNDLDKLQNLIKDLSDLVEEQAVRVHFIILSKVNWSKH